MWKNCSLGCYTEGGGDIVCVEELLSGVLYRGGDIVCVEELLSGVLRIQRHPHPIFTVHWSQTLAPPSHLLVLRTGAEPQQREIPIHVNSCAHQPIRRELAVKDGGRVSIVPFHRDLLETHPYQHVPHHHHAVVTSRQQHSGIAGVRLEDKHLPLMTLHRRKAVSQRSQKGSGIQ